MSPAVGALIVIVLLGATALGIALVGRIWAAREAAALSAQSAIGAEPAPSLVETDEADEPLEPAAAPAIEEEPPSIVPGADPAPQAAATAPASSAAPAASAKQPKAFSEAEIRAAMRRVSVTMYSTTWCRVCDRARGFFRANGINVVEKDVEANATASREQSALNPDGSVPTIKIDEQVFVGFSERELTRMLVTSAVRRLEKQ